MADSQSMNDMFEQARRAEQDDVQQANAFIGQQETTREQNGYQATIDQHQDDAAPKQSLLTRASAWVEHAAVQAVTSPADDLKAAWNGLPGAYSELSKSYLSAVGGIANLPVRLGIPTLNPFVKQASDADLIKANDAGIASAKQTAGAIGSALQFDRSKSDNPVGDFVQATTQFLAGRLGGGGAVANVASMALAFDPKSAHAVDYLASIPGLSKPVQDALAAKPDDPEWEGRLRGALDGLGFEVAAVAVGGLVTWVKGARAASQLAEDIKDSTKIEPTPTPEPAPEPGPTVNVQANRDAFMKEYEALPDHETNLGTKKLGGTSVELTKDPTAEDTVHIENIRADEGNKGAGTAAMQKLTQMADQHGVKLTLDSSPMKPNEGEAAIPQEKLDAFYGKHGFEPSDRTPLAGNAMDRAAAPQAPPKGWVPPAVEATDTANPKQVGEMAEQPKPGEAPAAVFNPNTIAKSMEVPKDKEAQVLKAIQDGKFADAAATMTEDTHRTFPWDNMSDAANMKGVFNAVTDAIGKLINKNHGVAPVSRESVQQLAADLGGDRGLVDSLYQHMTQDGGLAARITAGYNMLMASGKQLKTLALAAKDLDPKSPVGQQALLAFQKQLAIHAAITGEVRQSSAEIGRALWAHRNLKASTDVALTGLGDYANTTLGSKALKQLASQVANAKTFRELTAASDALQQRGWKQVLVEVAQNGMLSGPKTQITNAVGNAGNVALKIAERYVAGTMGEIRSVLFGTENTATIRAANAYAAGALSSLKVSSRLAWEALKHEDYGQVLADHAKDLADKAEKSGLAEDKAAAKNAADLADKAAKFGAPPRQMIRMKTAEGVAPDVGSAVAKALRGDASFPDFTYRQVVNSTGNVIRWPGRVMGLFDHFSQGMGYHGDLNAQAYTQSATEADAKGLTGDIRDKWMSARQDELFKNPLTQMDQHAMAAGRYTAFLEPPQTKIGKGLYQALNNTDPLLKLVVAPFTHRPGNILRQGVGDYTLAGYAQANIRAAIRAGGADADLARARMLIGTSVFAGGVAMAANGLIVGQRLGAKNTESLDAVPQYSLNLGGRWFKFDRLDPVGMWLGLAADAHEAYAHHYDPNDPDSTTALEKASAAAVLALTHTTLDKSFMKSIQDIMEAGSAKPDTAASLAEKLVSDNVAKLVPFSGLGRTVAQLVDPTQRATGKGSLFDGAVAEIPYLSQELPPRRDLLGREMPVVSAWNPFMSTKGNDDQLSQELSRVAVSINAPSRTINGYTLNAHEYDEVLNYAMKTPLFDGMTAEEYLKAYVASDAWQQAKTAPDAGQLQNGTIVQQVLDKAYTYGREMYMVNHPDFAEKKAQERQNAWLRSIAPEQPQATTTP